MKSNKTDLILNEKVRRFYKKKEARDKYISDLDSQNKLKEWGNAT